MPWLLAGSFCYWTYALRTLHFRSIKRASFSGKAKEDDGSPDTEYIYAFYMESLTEKQANFSLPDGHPEIPLCMCCLNAFCSLTNTLTLTKASEMDTFMRAE